MSGDLLDVKIDTNRVPWAMAWWRKALEGREILEPGGGADQSWMNYESLSVPEESSPLPRTLPSLDFSWQYTGLIPPEGTFLR